MLNRHVAKVAVMLSVGMTGMSFTHTAHGQTYPRIIGSGMNFTIDYGPMGQGNVVGGGRVTVTQPNGMDVNVMHLDSVFTQRPRDGFIPMIIGSGESQETVWVPSMMLEMLRRAQAGTAPR